MTTETVVGKVGQIPCKHRKVKHIAYMRTRRPFPINNGLCHGICNYNCRLCGVNKKTYKGPTAYQKREITEKLIERVIDAGAQGIEILHLANAGDGEPTLHPKFAERMTMFGDMLRSWNAPVSAPELTIVTNGSRLTEESVWPALIENPITVNVSFPTYDAQAYGEIMFSDAGKGKDLFPRVTEGIRKMMAFRAEERLSALNFHISPPEHDIIRRDFDGTMDFLTRMAASVNLDRINLIMFPGRSNRSGLIRNRARDFDPQKDLFRRYREQRVNGVVIGMKSLSNRLFRGFGDILDLIRAFDFPCPWNSNIFITAEGDVICSNDQAVRNPFGNIMNDDLVSLMQYKESFLPEGTSCPGCDASPCEMRGSLLARFMSVSSRLRIAYARWARRL